MKRLFLTLIMLIGVSVITLAQTDEEAVRATANDYIEGTSNGDIARIKRAFTETAALYGVNPDGSIRHIPIAKYVTYFKPNVKNDRRGKIVAVDIVNNAANVKIEILSQGWKYTDFLLLLKLKDGWKIINKSYTRVKAN